MAKLYPTLENIKRFKVQPTEGEWYLINYLISNFKDNVEIYFQPFLNGDMPDIILIQKNIGVTIIEVKDWDLDAYRINDDNTWHTKNKGVIKSPFNQVKSYKDNMFNLNIDGLLELKLRNEDINQSIYGKIKTFVYFHKTSRTELSKFVDKQIADLKKLDSENNRSFKSKLIEYKEYENKRIIIKYKIDNIKKEFDYSSVANDNLEKITLPNNDGRDMLNDKIYKEFIRYLQPPIHTLEMGKNIKYTDEQKKLIQSKKGFQKIKGVAGSGKTAVLAKRAVDAYKRHGQRVLILTYNLTLVNYIHDKISDVKEEFPWDKFYIINYHEFFKQNLNFLGVEIKLTDEIKNKIKDLSNDVAEELIGKFFEENYYSNKTIFKEFAYGLRKYKSIFIDEVQDYSSQWIYIIKNFMLEDDGEMVLFGDEKQDIYKDRKSKDEDMEILSDFTEWNVLTQATRQSRNGDRIIDLSKKFQQKYFAKSYELDNYDNQINQLKLKDGIFKQTSYRRTFNSFKDELNIEIERIVKIILEEVRENNIHNNDYCILSSRIDILKELDYVLRKKYSIKTMTTFESKERFIDNNYPKNNLISTIHKNKKLHFWSNSGTVKLATIHSYKGFEADTVFLILNQTDTEEQVYTGITRSKSNLMVFLEENNNYKSFFDKTLNIYELVKKDDEIAKQLADCIANQLVINIEYKEKTSVKSITDIKPYKILSLNDNLYLACEVDNDYKFSMYRVSNVLDIETNYENKFDIDIDIDDFIAHIQTPFVKYQRNYKKYLLEVVVEIDKEKARYFKSKQFFASQKLLKVLDNGNIRLSYTVTQELEMEELIKKWIPHVKVIEPKSLDERIKEDIKQYLL